MADDCIGADDSYYNTAVITATVTRLSRAGPVAAQ